MVVAFTLSESTRNQMGVLLLILFASLAFVGLCLIFVGIHVQIHINNELLLLESYNSGLLPNFIGSIGSIMFLLNGASAKLAYDSGFASTREKFRMTLLPVIATLFLFSWVILAAGITCLASGHNIEDALHDGLRDAMKRYGSNKAIKVTIDNMQMKSRCCGSRSYKDWFSTAWTHTKYINPALPQVQK